MIYDEKKRKSTLSETFENTLSEGNDEGYTSLDKRLLQVIRVLWCQSHPWQASKIGKNSNVHATTIFRQGRNIIIGERCFINHNAMLQGGKVDAKIKIGNDVLIGANVMMYAYNHGFYTRDTPMNVQDYFEADIVIEDDVQICAGAIILAGVHIGKGAVIGAGSVVNSDVPEYAIAAGVPAKVVKMRP